MVSKDNLQFCTFGAIFRIDNIKSGLSKQEGSHPWIIVEDFDESNPRVAACVRTTSGNGSVEIPAFYDGHQVDRFDRDGRVDPGFLKPIHVDVIRLSRYCGRLPAGLCDILRDALFGGTK